VKLEHYVYLVSLKAHDLMSQKTWFDRRFDDNLLLRDLVLVAFCVFGYGIPMGVFMGFRWLWGIGSGVLFAVLFLTVMEIASRRKGESMFRYFFGGDPLAEEESTGPAGH